MHGTTFVKVNRIFLKKTKTALFGKGHGAKTNLYLRAFMHCHYSFFLLLLLSYVPFFHLKRGT